MKESQQDKEPKKDAKPTVWYYAKGGPNVNRVNNGLQLLHQKFRILIQMLTKKIYII
jgi:hypothetical protein